MKLDRNTNKGRGKYAIVRLRDAVNLDALRELEVRGHLEVGGIGDEDEFFVLKLKDKYAAPALMAYAEAAAADDPEYASEVLELATRSLNHPHRRRPD